MPGLKYPVSGNVTRILKQCKPHKFLSQVTIQERGALKKQAKDAGITSAAGFSLGSSELRKWEADPRRSHTPSQVTDKEESTSLSITSEPEQYPNFESPTVMFKGKSKASAGPSPSSYDYTRSLRDVAFHKYGHLRSLGLQGEVTALAVDPVGSWMAVGTSTGLVHLLGSTAFQCTLYLNVNSAGTISNSRAAGSGRDRGGTVGVKFMTFHPGAMRLVVIDIKDALHSWFLGPGCMDDVKGTPMKEVVTSLYGEVTAIDTPSPAHSHLFLTLRDGTTLAFDLARRNLSPYKIPNCWAQHLDRMRRSGVPGRSAGGKTPMGTCLAVSPRDLNTILIGYEGGVVAWDMKEKQAIRHYELVLPPGSPGGLSYSDLDIWSERTPGVTSLAWRPDGLAFAVGHDDGCIAIWALEDADKPIMVRTVEKEDVNVTDAEGLFDAGVLDDQLRGMGLDPGTNGGMDNDAMPVYMGGDGQAGPSTKASASQPPEPREPIFKLAWASFPDASSLNALMTAQGTEAAGEPLSNVTVEYANRGETLLIVLGGCLPRDKPAINILQMPPFHKPITNPLSQSEGMSLGTRTAFRDSLRVSGMSQYLTETPVEDFVLMPRSNPYYGLAHDPIAIILFTTPDARMPTPPPPNALRSVEAWTFPPPRSDTPPEDSRKDFHTVTNEVHQVMHMTSAPIGPGSSLLSLPVASPRSASSWGLPWTPVPASPSYHAYREGTAGKDRRVKPAKRLRLPSILWTGATSVLGCEIYSLANETFTKLIRYNIENMGKEEKPRLPLRGGVAVPDLLSPNAAEPLNIKMERYRVMATWSPDGAVRFWDVSPHLLTLPSPLRFEYPSPLPHLTISITHVITHPSLSDLPIAKLYKSNPELVQISAVEMSRESLECLISMSTGEVFVYKFAAGKAGVDNGGDTSGEDYFGQQQVPEQDETQGHGHYDEITRLGHLASTKADGFKPVMVLTTQQGGIIKTALSDIGFFAVTYTGKSMAVVDLRGPDVILREGFTAEGRRVKKRKKGTQDLPTESTHCVTLKWTICNLGNDPAWAPRLIASYAKGLNKIFTLLNVLGEWVVVPKALTFSHESLARPLRSFVLDLATGTDMAATPDHFATAMNQQPSGSSGKTMPAGAEQVVWVACAAKSLRVQLNLSGDRISKQEMEVEELTSVHVVIKNGNKVLTCFTRTGVVLLFSLPMLEFINKIDLSLGVVQKPLGRVIMDEYSGDFLEYISSLEIHLRTLFNHRRPLPPRVDPCTTKHVLPPPPIPADALFGVSSWIWGGAPLTGAQLDALLAGPNRPTVAKMASGQAAPKQPKSLIMSLFIKVI